MVFGLPVALFPAVVDERFGGNSLALGALYAAPFAGSLVDRLALSTCTRSFGSASGMASATISGCHEATHQPRRRTLSMALSISLRSRGQLLRRASNSFVSSARRAGGAVASQARPSEVSSIGTRCPLTTLRSDAFLL